MELLDGALQQALQNYQAELALSRKATAQAAESESASLDRFEAFCLNSLTPALHRFTAALAPYGLMGAVQGFKRDAGKSGERSASLSYQFQPDPLIQRQPAYPKVVFYCFGPNISVMFQGFSIVLDGQQEPQPLHEDVPDRHERRGTDEFTTIDEISVEWCLDAVRRALFLALPETESERAMNA
jgi:hypothetical protein